MVFREVSEFMMGMIFMNSGLREFKNGSYQENKKQDWSDVVDRWKDSL